MAITEEPILPTEPTVDPTPADLSPAKEEKAAPKQTEKKTKKKPAVAKTKKVPAPKKKNATHPSYFEMVEEAISALKERMGSSQYAIQKFTEDKHKGLPPNFRKLLLNQLRKFVANGKLVKIKNSYKLPSRSSKPVATAPAPVKKTVTAAKPKPTAASAAKKVVKKAVAAKPKAAEKPKATGTKRKVPAKAVKKPAAKVAKNSVKSTPSKAAKPVRKAAVTKKATPVKKVVKKVPAKAVKPKTVKSPAKKVAAKRGNK